MIPVYAQTAVCFASEQASGAERKCGRVRPAVSENQENHQETGAYSAGGNHRPADAEATATVGGQSYYGTPNMSGTSTGDSFVLPEHRCSRLWRRCCFGTGILCCGTSGQPYTQGGQENANPAGGYGAGAQGQPYYGAQNQGAAGYGAGAQGQPYYGGQNQGPQGLWCRGRRDSPIMAVRIRDRRAYGAGPQGQPYYGGQNQGPQGYGAGPQGQPYYGQPYPRKSSEFGNHLLQWF